MKERKSGNWLDQLGGQSRFLPMMLVEF